MRVVLDAPGHCCPPLLTVGVSLMPFHLVQRLSVKRQKVWDVDPLDTVRVHVWDADAVLLGDRNAPLDALIEESSLPGGVHVFLPTGEWVELPLGPVGCLGTDLALLEEITSSGGLQLSLPS